MWGQKRRVIKCIPYAAVQYWKHCFHEGQMLLREFNVFSGDFRDCCCSCWRQGKGKMSWICFFYASTNHKSLCLSGHPALSVRWFLYSTSMICWWYDQLKGWKARKMCNRWSGSGPDQKKNKKCFFCFFFGMQRKESKVTWLNIQRFGVINLYFYSPSVHLIDQKWK